MTASSPSPPAGTGRRDCSMFMRLVHLNVAREPAPAVRSFYRERIIPALRDAEGCCWAGLLEPTSGAKDDWVSLTLWRSRDAAEAYEASGLYDRLLDDIDEITGADEEWRARLHEPHAVGPHPVREPDVQAYDISAPDVVEALDMQVGTPFFRIVTVRTDAGRLTELKQRFEDVIIPAVRAMPGCRAILFVEEPPARSRALSVSIWDSEAAALRYEASGRFDELTERVSDLLSGYYEWRRTLVEGGRRPAVSGSDLDVVGYRVVVGEVLRR